MEISIYLINLQKEEEKLRMAMRMQSKPKKSSSGSRGAASRAAANYGNDPYHDEGSDDENAISLAAIKNKYKKPAAAGGGVSKRERKYKRLFDTYFLYFSNRFKSTVF